MADEETSIIEFSTDLSDVEAPQPLPVGEYHAEIRSAERRESANGNVYAAVGFYISPEEYPADYPTEEAPDGKVIVYRRAPLGNSKPEMFRLKRFIEAIGGTTSKRVDLSEWIGLQARVMISHDSYEGVEREQIDRVNPA